MQVTWLSREDRAHCILFFAGWGMDERPFRRLASTACDVAVVYDYTEDAVPIDFKALFDAYGTVDLLAWSFGVAVANQVCLAWRSGFRRCVALNGSLVPIDARYGIAPAIFEATRQRLGQGGLERFRRRMCGGRTALERFMATVPDRDLDSLVEELDALGQRFRGPSIAGNVFTCAWIGTEDRIIPAASQRCAWDRFGVDWTWIDAPHFAFDAWAAWEEIVAGHAHR